jgi:hypothetical protein
MMEKYLNSNVGTLKLINYTANLGSYLIHGAEFFLRR